MQYNAVDPSLLGGAAESELVADKGPLEVVGSEELTQGQVGVVDNRGQGRAAVESLGVLLISWHGSRPRLQKSSAAERGQLRWP